MSSSPTKPNSASSSSFLGESSPSSTAEEDRKRLEAAISRLSQENARHREDLEQLAAVIRLRAGQDVDVSCLKPIAALNKILDSRDDLVKKSETLVEVIGQVRLLLSSRGNQAAKEVLDYVRKRLGGR